MKDSPKDAIDSLEDLNDSPKDPQDSLRELEYVKDKLLHLDAVWLVRADCLAGSVAVGDLLLGHVVSHAGLVVAGEGVRLG